jgi:hypothetical protein
MEIFKLKYAFRFCNLEPEAFEEVKNALSSLTFSEANDYHGGGRKVLGFYIEEGKDYSSVFELIRTGKYSDTEYGLFVMFTSNETVTGIEFPEYVLQFYKQSGGQIDISIIFESRKIESD